MPEQIECKYNIYRDYYNLPFTKIYWSRLVPIRIKLGRYVCECCNLPPHECKNERSAKEYDKIRQVVELDGEYFGVTSYVEPIRATGYLRADQIKSHDLIWKIQRELAKSAGFTLSHSSFW